MNNSETIIQLEKNILKHNYLYMIGQTEVSDFQYDNWKEELKSLDPDNPVLLRVGSEPSFGKKVNHLIPMGSLDKITYDKDINGNIDGTSELEKWLNEHPDEIVWSLKIDGVACELVYKNGVLFSAATRGNGTVGSDCTDNAMMITDIPHQIATDVLDTTKHEIRFRGEVYIPRQFFNDNLKDKFENPRNTTAGAINCSEPKLCHDYGLRFICYKILIDGHELESEINSMQFCNRVIGQKNDQITTINHVTVKTDTLNENILADVSLLRKSLDMDTDGLVISVNNIEKQKSYGSNGLIPKGKVAFKFETEKEETILLGCEWNTGRTGKLTPVALLQPVSLDGSTVSRATMSNYSEIKRLGVYIGCTVLLEKGGDIIPHIINVVNPDTTKHLPIPDKCPVCEHELVLDDDNVNLWCRNKQCKSRLIQRILHHLNVLEIKEIGEALVTTLVEQNIVYNLPSLYCLDKGDISQLEGYGERSEQIVLESLENGKNTTLDKFLASLGIPTLGRTLSKTICEHYDCIADIMETTVEKLVELPDIGPITANNILNGLNEYDNRNEVNQLVNIFSFLVEQNNDRLKVLTGKTFCITGKLSFGRKDFQTMIEMYNGKYTGINKNLDYLIIGSGAKQNKIDKAKSNGTIVITEEEFNELIKIE